MNIKDFTTGVQHIGIPTNNIEDTINFLSYSRLYNSLAHHQRH